MTDKNERSTSRGREAFHSSGRGGLGNIRQASASRDRPTDGPDDFSITRGREAAPSPSRQVYSTGRGGAGNIRSPSRDPQPNTNSEYEAQVVKKHNESEAGAIHSSGRGGLGNISRSRSRDPTRLATSPVRHSTGRGGAGNMFAGEAPSNIAEEQERRGLRETEGVHSTGRGGFANLTSTPTPAVEHHKHTEGEYESSGRGGVGNIHMCVVLETSLLHP
ncbi:hypothetical protein BDN71DRAFT_1483462 [Pleurotus eryngii]|uniref:Uncharacterized protein n=1 Tax=Pleurotus eryngii TaxID=5323 RepID=A0A9P5ZS44_PLEER|nr:hypothetical protein BDN71DRAFT_1483462 [Pleurotus eryngii]